jgi:hypothetical protein
MGLRSTTCAASLRTPIRGVEVVESWYRQMRIRSMVIME